MCIRDSGCGLPMGVCLICLAWAALWLQSPYGRVLNMFGMGRPMAAVSLWACAEYVRHTYLHTRDAAMEITMRQTLHLCMFLLRGPPYSCALHLGVCLICLAWAALWLRSPYGRVLNMFGMGRPMAAVSLWACA